MWMRAPISGPYSGRPISEDREEGNLDTEEFLQLVYDHFKRGSAWPRALDLQREVRQRANIKLVAARIGLDLVVCDEGADGVCCLTLRGLARCRHADEDIENFLAAARFFALRFIEHGRGPVSSESLAEELGLDERATRRLGHMLYRGAPFTSGGTWPSDGSHFSFNTSEDALWYEHVQTLEDYFNTQKRSEQEAVATSQLRFRHESRRTGLSAVEATTIQYFDDAEFGKRHPEALARWRNAESQLSAGEQGVDLTVVGHICREAMQIFATSFLARHPCEADKNPANTVARLRAAISSPSIAREPVRKILNPLLSYWGEVSDLVQRQEHGAQKEGAALNWEDARRLVFHTAFVMIELDRVAR